MKEALSNGSGVQELIEKIRSQGVKAAQDEAESLLRDARRQAAEIVASAKAEAEAERAAARAEVEAFRAASLDALRLAARDTVLGLKDGVIKRFEEFVRRLVVSATREEEIVRSIVLVLAGHAADEFIKDKEVRIRVSRALLNEQPQPEFKEEGKAAMLRLSSDMLREGIELVSEKEIEGGVRVQLVKERLEIDLSDRAIGRLISQRLIPRFKAILEGTA
jgi:V/A-type H+-transporting ATPase subunit E